MNKTLKATLQALLEVVASEDGDMLDSLQASPSTESLKSTNSDPGTRQTGRRRSQQQETETFYITVGLDRWNKATKGSRKEAELRFKLETLLWVFQKLQEYLSGRSILAKLQAKHEKLQEAIQRGGSCSRYTLSRTQSCPCPPPSDLIHAPP